MSSAPNFDVPLAINGEQVRENFVSVNGCRIRYLTAGTGLPLILIHGLLGYSFSWRFNIAALAAHYSVYAIDLPGVGFSERVAGRKGSLATLTLDVVGFVKQLCLKNPVLLGSSHGGAIAMMTAALAPTE